MKLLDTYLPENPGKRKWFAVSFTLAISTLLTLWGIYGIGEYGIALFVLTPLFMGFGSTILLGYKRKITIKEAKGTAYLTLGVFTAALILFAIEGLICIAMASPFALILTWIGANLGYAFVERSASNARKAMFILIGIIPGTATLESRIPPQLNSVVTSVDIKASPSTVWQNVIAFPQLQEPTELIFKAGIAYPINARIEGSGVGAVRHCNFTTGSFVEPVTVWDKPYLLAFDVVEQPAPLKEISFWDIDAPHLHDYFVSKKGQFRLIKLSNGHTRLEGTTWYYHNIKPASYWRLWSSYIIHQIHGRVLNHIKSNSEKDDTRGIYHGIATSRADGMLLG